MKALAIGFLMVIALAALAPLPTRYDRQFRDSPNARPSRQFPLGTDDLGRDRLSRLIYGTRVSLLLATAAALLSCVMAAALGGVAGLAGGITDKVILGVADLFLSLPWLFLLLMVRAVGRLRREWFARRCAGSLTPISCCKRARPDARHRNCCGVT